MAVEGSDVPRDRIPVVDFSAMGLQNKDPLKENNQAIKELADQLYQAFSKIGFVYLKNHGIPQEMVRCHLVTPGSCRFPVISGGDCPLTSSRNDGFCSKNVYFMFGKMSSNYVLPSDFEN